MIVFNYSKLPLFYYPNYALKKKTLILYFILKKRRSLILEIHFFLKKL